MQSLTELYIELREPVFHFLRALTSDPDLAEELTQETFLQAVLSLHRWRGEASVRAWLFGIARNVYRKRMRHEQQRRRRTPLAEPSPAADPSQAAQAHEEQQLLARALAALPEAMRTALVLREYRQFSFAEVGAALGRTETWARVTCFRARQQLRERYIKETGGDGP